MALLQILLLLLYALPSFLLPITSNPLGLEDTPDNLAWAAQSLDSPSEHEGVRKIAKSIFITPNNYMDCQLGYKLQDGQCIKAQNFDVNPLALITSQFQQFLDKGSTTVDYDEDYDYDNYDSTESAGPYHVPLSLSFDDDPPIRGSVDDGIQNMPFLAGNYDRKEETSQKYTISTSTESKSTQYENVVPITPTVVSNVNDWADDNLAYNKDSTRTGEVVKPTTTSNIIATTPDESLLAFNDGMGISTTQKKVLVDADANLPDNAFLEKVDENKLSTAIEVNPTTTMTDNESSTNKESTTLQSDQKTAGDHDHMVHNRIELTTQVDDQNILDKELQSESLFQSDSLTGTSINVSDGTTEINENDIEITTESLNSLLDKEVNKAISISTPTSPFNKPSNKVENPIVVVPTVEQVQIVTPVHLTTTSHSTNHHRKKPNSQSMPSSTSAYKSELQTAERSNINESMLNKKLRESVMKHELNEDAIETIDTNNRFVYTHLDSSSNEPEPSSTTSTTMQPPTQRSLLDQLRFINRFTDESRKNNRIRFPEPATQNIFSNFKGGTIKFPGPVQQRTSEPLFNRLIPDIIPKKPPEPTAERPLFSWLPAGTTFDFSRNSNPAFMRFWNKMPLIRDPSMTPNDSPEQSRSNSKSPTDNLYKDAPASEVYKVIASKNYKHDNR